MVELIKEKLTTTPQISTAGGLTGIIYQLAQVLENIKVGEFFKTLSEMTYGGIVMDYGIFIAFIMLILFDEKKINFDN